MRFVKTLKDLSSLTGVVMSVERTGSPKGINGLGPAIKVLVTLCPGWVHFDSRKREVLGATTKEVVAQFNRGQVVTEADLLRAPTEITLTCDRSWVSGETTGRHVQVCRMELAGIHSSGPQFHLIEMLSETGAPPPTFRSNPPRSCGVAWFSLSEHFEKYGLTAPVQMTEAEQADWASFNRFRDQIKP